MFIQELKKYYTGFALTDSTGNNAFSYEKRRNQSLWVAPLIEGTPDDLEVSERIVFSEFIDGKEVNCFGLENFIYYRKDGKTFIIFDNHNHAFFFWVGALQEGLIQKNSKLVHVDQHTDMRPPLKPYEGKLDLKEAFEYTQSILNVGCFIKPALDLKIFSSVCMIQNSEDFDKKIEGPIVLDLDMDIFSPELSYIPYEKKVQTIKKMINEADFITIATSPFFIDQQAAIKIIKILIV